MSFKKFQKVFLVFAIVSIVLSVFSIGSATKTSAKGTDVDKTPDSFTSSFTFEDYLKGIEEGYIATDVSYEELKQANEAASADQLEKDLIAQGFEKVYDSGTVGTFASYTMKKGDVMVSSETSYNGITGHAAIALSSTSMLHIKAPGAKPTTHSLSYFKTNYGGGKKMKMYRLSNTTAASKAADWVSSKYKGSNATYRISNDLSTTSHTYCSKIVYQGYYFGAKAVSWMGTAIVLPYALKNILPYKYSLSTAYTY